MEIRCSTPIDAIRKCRKYLGTFDVLVGKIYCKSCKKSNYYEVISEQGLQKLKKM